MILKLSLSLVLLVLLCLVSIQAVLAQQVKRTLPPGTIQSNRVRVNKRPPIPFNPITLSELKDPTTGAILTPASQVHLRNGRTMPAAEFLQQLNDLEREFNAMGYTIRGHQTVQLQETILDTNKLQTQGETLRSKRKPRPQGFKPVTASQAQTEFQNLVPRNSQGTAELKLTIQKADAAQGDPNSTPTAPDSSNPILGTIVEVPTGGPPSGTRLPTEVRNV